MKNLFYDSCKKYVLYVLYWAFLSCYCTGCLTKQEQVVAYAEKWLGTKYEYGGETATGIDCSALMQKSFRTVGCILPRTSAEQANVGKHIPLNEVRVGDLLFFEKDGVIGHVGLVVGGTGEDCEFIHASGTDGIVLKTKFATSERRATFRKARRVL